MRNIVFTAPFPMATTLQFARALRTLDGVRLLGVFGKPPPDPSLFDDLVLVSNAVDPNVIAAAVEKLQARHGKIYRLLGVLEDLQVQLAQVRAHLGIEGPTPRVADLFRDKGRMKDALRAQGIPCARHARIRSDADAWAFVDQVGFPVVMKPPSGAGARATERVSSPQGLATLLKQFRPTPEREWLAEEFLTGAEFTFETLTVGGEPVFHSICRYFPGPLEVMEKSWIQWTILLPRDISGPEFNDVRDYGRRTIKTLGLQDGMTHMEWFRRPDGSLAIGEIAARPPGAQIVKLMAWAHERDMHRAWARAVVDGAWDGPYERKYAAGVAFLRGQGEGKVVAVDGLAEAQARVGHLVVEAQLPQIGTPRASGYEGEGWVILRHPDTEVVKKALFDLITTVKVRYG